jgi:hypothetical protein
MQKYSFGAICTLFCCLFSWSLIFAETDVHEEMFHDFQTKYSKSYSTIEEHTFRLSVFKVAVDDSEQHFYYFLTGLF